MPDTMLRPEDIARHILRMLSDRMEPADRISPSASLSLFESIVGQIKNRDEEFNSVYAMYTSVKSREYIVDQIPTIGRIVHYKLTAEDAKQANQRRSDSGQIRVGNSATEGDVYPMMITRVWGDKPDAAVNGQVFLDGNDTLWVTSTHVGDGPRMFTWPTRS